MKKEKNKKRLGLRELIEAFVIGAMVFIMTITNLISPLDYMLKDFLYQIPRGVENKIKIIAIDERTLDALGPIGTWSRNYYAELIEKLNTYDEAKPAVIGFDIIFSGNVDSEGDTAFANAAKESGNVVVGSQIIYKGKAEKNADGVAVYPVDYVVYPYSELLSVCETGYVNVAQDSDSTVRRIQLNQSVDEAKFDVFSRKIYETYCEATGADTDSVPMDKYGKTLINYSGRPGDYEHISMIDVLEGRNIDYRAFRGSIVIVGAYAQGLQDSFYVPNGYSSQMYGVEIHANLIQAFLDNRFAINANPYICAMILGVLAALLYIVIRKCKIWISTLVLIASIVAELVTGVILNNNGISMSLVYLPLALIIAYIYSLAIGYILEALKRKKVLNAFKKYVAPEIVEEISRKGDFQIKLSGENKDIAVLFVDIRGFTTMSEALEPEQVVEILNNYLNLTTQAIFKNKGTLDKFVGDATMAVFNSPFDLEDYVYHAVCAAMDIVAGGAALEEKLMEQFGRSVGFGVGVNCGPAVIGNVGCEFRMDFTAIGDTVNTAARLEANAKKGQVLISDEVYNRLKDRIEVEPVGEIPLKGKTKGIFVYSVTGIERVDEK